MVFQAIFSFGTESYLLRPAGPGRSVIYEFIPPAPQTEPCFACDNTNSPCEGKVYEAKSISPTLPIKVQQQQSLNSKKKTSKAVVTAGNGICAIDLAVGFTPEIAGYVDMEAEAALIVAQMNHALICSGITNFCYRLAGQEELSFLLDNGTQYGVQGILDQMLPPFESDIVTFRSEYKADRVLVVKTNNFEPGIGIAQPRTAPVDRWRAVIIDGSLAFYTPSHELAHNQGCQHLEDAISGGAGELNLWARSHIIGSLGTTIMSESYMLNSGQQRTFNFSNPDVWNWLGQTGLTDRDNAEQLRSTGCDIAGLIDSVDPDWSQNLWISPMDNNTCPGDLASFTVRDRCQNSTVGSITWSLSINGGPFQFVQTTSGPTINLTLPQTTGYAYIDIKAEGHCGNGGIVSSTYRTSISQCHDPCGQDALEAMTSEEVDLNFSRQHFVKYQKLDNQSLVITFSITPDILEVFCVDLLGRVYSSNFEVSSNGEILRLNSVNESARFISILTTSGVQTFPIPSNKQ